MSTQAPLNPLLGKVPWSERLLADAGVMGKEDGMRDAPRHYTKDTAFY